MCKSQTTSADEVGGPADQKALIVKHEFEDIPLTPNRPHGIVKGIHHIRALIPGNPCYATVHKWIQSGTLPTFRLQPNGDYHTHVDIIAQFISRAHWLSGYGTYWLNKET